MVLSSIEEDVAHGHELSLHQGILFLVTLQLKNRLWYAVVTTYITKRAL